MIEHLLPNLIPYFIGGLFSGFLSGLLGIGGGIIYVSILLYILILDGYANHLHMHVAVGTSLAIVVFAALISARAHAKHGGGIDFTLIKKWAFFLIAGSISGGIIVRFFSADMMKIVFCISLLYMSTRFIKKSASVSSFTLPAENIYFRATLGWLIGVVSALIGIGGSVFTTPTLMACRVPIHRAIAVAPIVNLMISFPAAIAFGIQGIGIAGRPAFSIGYVNIGALICFIPAILISVPLGARLAHHLDPLTLKRVYGFFLLFTSLNVGLSVFDTGVINLVRSFS